MAGPAEVVRLADAAGLAVVALTDHDTTAGLPEARREAAKFPHLSLVPGIEVSARFSPGILHVLGLGVAEGVSQVLFRTAGFSGGANLFALFHVYQAGLSLLGAPFYLTYKRSKETLFSQRLTES